MSSPAYASGGGDQPLLDQTIPDNLAATVQAHGQVEALVSCHQGIRLSYDEFHQAVRRCATGLLARGLGKGDRLGSGAQIMPSGLSSSTQQRKSA